MIEAKRDEARRLRARGYSYEEIAERFDCTEMTVYNALNRKAKKRECKCVYPGLEAWRQKAGLTLTGMCIQANLDPELMKKLSGRLDPNRLYVSHIKSLLALTGLTFEEAFGNVEDV